MEDFKELKQKLYCAISSLKYEGKGEEALAVEEAIKLIDDLMEYMRK